MVSILSFFTKKRPKAAAPTTDSTKTPSTPAAAPSQPSPPRASTSSRVARTKSVRVPVTTTFKDRRASLDAVGFGKRGAKGSAAAGVSATVAAAPPRITIDLPFDFESPAVDADASGTFSGKRAARQSLPASHSLSLGLEAVGGTPTITSAERRALDSQRYTPADLQKAWEWLGTQVKERGAETVGIMLPRRFEANKNKQRQLSVLFVLARRPELANKFPTIASTYPAPKPDEAAEAWKSRLIEVAEDTENPVNIAEALKGMLRRLSANDRPIIDPSVYVRFVQQEHAASYPRNAYATMLIPHLSKDVVGLLDAVLEVCNAIAMHAETNAMGAGRLCHLIGWWLLGKIPDGTSGWSALYDEYKLAGQRAEHLFYARIRWQSTQQKMPRRLVQLILSYPFGESSASSEHLPLPPASTFARRALHVALGTDAALPSGTDPAKVLGDAIIAKLDAKAEANDWELLRTKDGRPVTVDELLSSDSVAFLDDVSSAKGIELTSPPVSPGADESYHPFADDGDRIVTSRFGHSRRRSASHGDIPRLEGGGAGSSTPSLEAVTEGGSPRKSVSSSLVRFGSSQQLSPKKTTPAWDDFEKSGFGDSLEVRDISLALTKPIASRKDVSANLQARKKVIVRNQAPSTNLIVSGEEVIDVDDAFIHFVEDGQLDPVASTSWPRFALVQLGTPVTVGADEVSWLLVTVKKRVVQPSPSDDDLLPDIRAQLTRSVSPSNESSISRLSSFGFRDLANTFRRSSLYAGGRSNSRMSFIHSSTHSKTPAKGESLSPVHERAGPRGSEASDAPTEYTIGDVGEMVKIPSALELAAIAAGTPRASTPVSAAATEAARPILASSPSEWIYLAEGGAHVVFRYNGSEPKLQGHALRLQKVAKKGAPDVALRQAWSEKLLPMIMPSHLIPGTTPAILDEKWTRALVTPTEIFRQANRRAEGSLSQIVDYSRPAQLMDNLTAPVKGEKVLALEIKPKWGFLPSASNLTPHESILIKTRNCRFCLHEHYRGSLVQDGFCPLDLYSGDQARVRRALDGLWKAWRASGGEKNNLRVFVDGNKVLPKDAHLIPTSGEDLPAGSYPLIEPLLTSSNVLATLKKLQANLDPQDISSLAQDFKAAYPTEQLFSAERVPEPTIPELTEFVMLYKRGEINWTLRQREIAYALSAIFKDCSIIVRAVLRPLADGYAIEPERSVVKVIDTDLKPLASLGHWAELDEKLWRHWAETNGESVVVVDSEAKALLGAESSNVIDISADAPMTPVTPTPRTPTTPITPITPVNDTVYAAAVLGASSTPSPARRQTTLTVSTPKKSPSHRDVKALSLSETPSPSRSSVPTSPVTSIPDVEDATSALARVVDTPISPVSPTEPAPEVLSNLKADSSEALQAIQAEPTIEPVDEPKLEAAAHEISEAQVEPDAEVPAEARPVEDKTAAPLVAAAVTAAAGAAVVSTTAISDKEPTGAKVEERSVSVPETAPVAAPTAEIATAETAEQPLEAAAPATATVPSPALEDKVAENKVVAEGKVVPAPTQSSPTTAASKETRPVKKPSAIDLTAAKFADAPSVVSPMTPVSVVDPSSNVEVPPEDAVDFEADPFAKAPVVLPRYESRTSLRAAAGIVPSASTTPAPPSVAISAPPSAPPSGAPSGVATPVAGIPTGAAGAATPATVESLSSSVSLQKTSSRVRDKIKAIENKDRDHKPVLPSSHSVASRGVGLGRPAASTSGPAPAGDKGKRPVKKGSFAAFVRKASATFERPTKTSTSNDSSAPASTPPPPAPAKLTPATPPSPSAPSSPPAAKPKEKMANPFGSLRSKKKQAAAAGAAAAAATATVATATLMSDDNKAKVAEQAPVEKSVAEVPSETASATENTVELPEPVAAAPEATPEAAPEAVATAPAAGLEANSEVAEVAPEAGVTEEAVPAPTEAAVESVVPETPEAAEPVADTPAADAPASPAVKSLAVEADPEAPAVEDSVAAVTETPAEIPEATVATAPVEVVEADVETVAAPVVEAATVPVDEVPEVPAVAAEVPAATVDSHVEIPEAPTVATEVKTLEVADRAIEAPAAVETESKAETDASLVAVPLAAVVAATAVPVAFAATAPVAEAEAPEVKETPVADAPETVPEVPVQAVVDEVPAEAAPVATGAPSADAAQEAVVPEVEPVKTVSEAPVETVVALEPADEEVPPAAVEETVPQVPVEDAAAVDAPAEPATPSESVPDTFNTEPVAAFSTREGHATPSPRVIPGAIEVIGTAADDSVPPTASTGSYTSALSPTALEAARSLVVTEKTIPEETIPDVAIPESAIFPTHTIPPVAPTAAASAAVVGLGLGALDSVPDEPSIAADPGVPVDTAVVTPTVGVEPPTPLPDSTPEAQYFTPATAFAPAEPEPKTVDFSAVTPEFAATSVFAPALDVSRNVGATEQLEETLADDADATLVNDDETETLSARPSSDAESRMKRSSAPSPSPHLAVAPETFQSELPEVVEKPEPKASSRAGSPLPGPPENVEMYQNASLPPLPIEAAMKESGVLAGIITSTPMAAQMSTDSVQHEVASQSSAEVDPTTFATAPDTPAFSDIEHMHVEDDEAETPTVDLPELAAFTRRMAERDRDDRRSSAQTFGTSAIAENYRSSIHTFGGTQSEAAWLNSLPGAAKVYEKSRLSLDGAETQSAITTSTLSPISDSVETAADVETKTSD